VSTQHQSLTTTAASTKVVASRKEEETKKQRQTKKKASKQPSSHTPHSQNGSKAEIPREETVEEGTGVLLCSCILLLKSFSNAFQVNFLQYPKDNDREGQIMRKYYIQDRGDYSQYVSVVGGFFFSLLSSHPFAFRYNKLAGMIKKLTTKLSKLDPKDPFRIRMTDLLMEKLFVCRITCFVHWSLIFFFFDFSMFFFLFFQIQHGHHVHKKEFITGRQSDGCFNCEVRFFGFEQHWNQPTFFFQTTIAGGYGSSEIRTNTERSRHIR
jgi:hypothetical protein